MVDSEIRAEWPLDSIQHLLASQTSVVFMVSNTCSRPIAKFAGHWFPALARGFETARIHPQIKATPTGHETTPLTNHNFCIAPHCKLMFLQSDRLFFACGARNILPTSIPAPLNDVDVHSVTKNRCRSPRQPGPVERPGSWWTTAVMQSLDVSQFVARSSSARQRAD